MRPRNPTDLVLELARLDALLAPHWPRVKGDVEAVEAVLEVIDRKILLLDEDHTGIRH